MPNQSNPGRPIRVAAICDVASQLATIAPFRDLARLARQVAAEFDELSSFPQVDLDVLHDATLPVAPFPRSLPVRLEERSSGYDAVVIPAGGMQPDLSDSPDPRLVAWVAAQHAAGAWVCGIGSGVLTVIATGLLDHGIASIPPRLAPWVRQHHPRVNAAPSRVAEHDRILTASEAASVFRLTVIAARRLHSDLLAERYRLICAIPEYADETLFPTRLNRDILVADARAWIIAHMHEDISADQLAARLNISTRTLTRRFQQALGMTPPQFLRLIRIDAARSMLERTRLSVDQISHLCGYRDTGRFRAVFRRQTGQSPVDYRMAASVSAADG